MTLSTGAKSANETKIEKLKNVDFGEMESDSDPDELQRKRDSGYNYEKPIRYNRPHYRSRNRERFSKHRNQLNRPFNFYGPPKTQETNLNQRPNNQYREPIQTSENSHQEVPQSMKNHNFAEKDPIPEQNDIPFLTGTANYLPPKNQKLPSSSTSNAFSEEQKHQNYLQDHRISDAALFLTQNAQSLSQLYGAPAPNQEYAPNNEYLNQLANQQQNVQNNLHSQMENVASTQRFPGPLPSYASGILNPQETLASIQSLEKDRLIAQLRLALENQAQLQDAVPLGRHSPVVVNHQSGNEDALAQQLVSPSVFGGERTAFGHASFLSGSAISPSGFRITYGPPSSSQVPASPVTTPTIRPQGPAAGDSSLSGSVGAGSIIPGLVGPGAVASGSARPGQIAPGLEGADSLRPGSSSFTPTFPQYGTYIPLIPGTNFVGNVPAFGSGFLGTGLIPIPSNPSSSPTHFGIPIPDQKPISGSPTLSIPANKPVVQISGPGHPVYTINTPVHPTAKPIHPVATPGQPIYPVSNPVHPVLPAANPIHPVAAPTQPIYPISNPVYPAANPILPAGNPIHPVAAPAQPIYPISNPVHPVTTPAFPEVTQVRPTYGVQSNFLNSLFIKPLKPVFPVYYYPNVNQIPKPTLTTHPWNYAITHQQSKPNWKR